MCRPDSRSDARPEALQVARPDAHPDPRPDAHSDPRSDARPDARAGRRSGDPPAGGASPRRARVPFALPRRPAPRGRAPNRPAARRLAPRLKALLRGFARRGDGALAIDSVLMLPVVLLVYTSAYVWYDGFRVQNLVQKATYTVADMITRETVPLTPAYLEGMTGVLDFMTQAPAPAEMRVTSLRCTDACDDAARRELELCWSWGSGTVPAHDAQSLAAAETRIPLMALGDTMIVTEAFLAHEPTLPVMEAMTMSTFIVMRPRFAPQVLFDGASCY